LQLAPTRRSKKPYSAFFPGLAGLNSWTRFKTNVAFFQAKHSASSVSAAAKSNAALTPCWCHCSDIELGLFDCSEIYEKTSENL
jgi:hypothetical protein